MGRVSGWRGREKMGGEGAGGGGELERESGRRGGAAEGVVLHGAGWRLSRVTLSIPPPLQGPVSRATC